MNDPRQKEIVRSTPVGPVQIRSFCTPNEIQAYCFDDQFGTHAQYKSIYTKRETLEKHASKADANVVLALTENEKIVGFGVFSHPEADERWTELGPGVMMEVKR